MTAPRIAVVTGASRGLGRGIALALGQPGTTVYVVGRTTGDGGPRREGEADLPGTIHDTAQAIAAAAGTAIPVACDLADDAQIVDLFRRVQREAGRLDILVNNAAYLHHDLTAEKPFWEKSLEVGNILGVGLRCHYVASHQAAPIMVRRRSGLIVNISFYGAVCRFHDPAYGAAKAGLDKLAFDMAQDLRPHDVTAVSLWPGFVATERVRLMAAQAPELAQQLPQFESPEFSGRVIDALHRDPDRMRLSGKTLIGAELGLRYGIRDIDGKQPAALRSVLAQPHPAFS